MQPPSRLVSLGVVSSLLHCNILIANAMDILSIETRVVDADNADKLNKYESKSERNKVRN